MMDRRSRATVLQLSAKGLGTRAIARALKISRGAVKKIIAQGTEEPEKPSRVSRLMEHREAILELTARCHDNLVRVHEELSESGVSISYPALTAFVRVHKPKPRIQTGRYHFRPGQEIQHDTSPHDVEICGKLWRLQTASAVLCHSRMLYFQCYVRFRRFEAKVFLTEALRFFDGASEQVMVDNTSVIVGRGSGATMEPAPEMAAFAERFSFVFKAHEVGDANRSARVERPFHFIENNFLNNRPCTDLADLNNQAIAWCHKVNGTYKKHLRAVPSSLFVEERAQLRRLPAYIPEPELIEARTVDVEGFVSVDSNRYSVPADWIHRRVQVRVTARKIEIDHGSKTIIHTRGLLPTGQRFQLPEHRRPHGQKARVQRQLDEENALAALLPTVGSYLVGLRKQGHKAPRLLMRRLLRMAHEYPHEALLPALEEAVRYGLYDLDRVERMVLRRVKDEYFRLEALDD